MKVPYVHSNYPRIENDNYQTVDPRCVQAFVEWIPIKGEIVDCCSPNGSGIVTQLQALGFNARGETDAFGDWLADWVVTNPPYKKGLVDTIVAEQIVRVQNKEFYGFAALLRTNFDHAKTRKEMFENSSYYGQIKMCFRPYWTEERKHSPIHNYVWHIWSQDAGQRPVVLYW